MERTFLLSSVTFGEKISRLIPMNHVFRRRPFSGGHCFLRNRCLIRIDFQSVISCRGGSLEKKMVADWDVWSKKEVVFPNLEAGRIALQNEDLLEPFFAVGIPLSPLFLTAMLPVRDGGGYRGLPSLGVSCASCFPFVRTVQGSLQPRPSTPCSCFAQSCSLPDHGRQCPLLHSTVIRQDLIDKH